MSVQGRIKELSRKHASLEAKITEELKHPAGDSLRIQTLKRRKLFIKQAIVRFKKQSPQPVTVTQTPAA